MSDDEVLAAMDARRIVAYQPDLFGAPARPGYACRPTFYRWTICGLPVSPSDDAIRQAKLMRRDTLAALTDHPGGTK